MPKATRIAFLVLAATSLVDSNSALAQVQPCRSKEYAHNAYTVCEVDLSKHTVRLYWKRTDGTLYAYLSSLPRTLEGEAGVLGYFGTAEHGSSRETWTRSVSALRSATLIS
jgi:uncharacterized protein YigE (DUF2233 family)